MQKQKTSPFSLRLTAEERALLEARAAGRPLGLYVRHCLFGESARQSSGKALPEGSARVVDRQALARLLALMGQRDMAVSLRQLAEAARLGALPVVPETRATLESACRDIAAMKRLLMAALGIAER